MNCSCCCTNTLDFCRQGICSEGIDFDILAQAAGVHRLVLDYLGIQIILLADLAVGEKIIFPVDQLNENFQYRGEIYDPSGNKIVIRKNLVDYDCVKFQTTLSLYAGTGSAIPPILDIPGTVVVESVVDDTLVITGTTEIVTGITGGSNTVTSNAFIGVRVIVIRGNVPIPGIDPLDGSHYFTKLLASDFITFNTPLVPGEFVRIQTIPE